MDLVSEMVSRRDALSVSFMKFVSLSKATKTTVCFFEGEDQKYYSIRLDMRLDTPWSGIDCHGKKNVLSLHSIITKHETYSSSLVAFFIDRDFEDIGALGSSAAMYVTPCYSIENFYCTDECLTKIFSIEFKMEGDLQRPEAAKQAITDFQALRDQFQTAMRPLNIWIKAHRLKEAREGLKPLNLKNVPLDHFVQINYASVIPTYTLAGISAKFPDAHCLSIDELNEVTATMPTADTHLHFRGKYQLEFVRKFLEKLRVECRNTASAVYCETASRKLQFSKENLISELSQYAGTPACLLNFLQHVSQRANAA